MREQSIGILSPLLAGSFFGGILSGVSRAALLAKRDLIAFQTLDGSVETYFGGNPSFYDHVGWSRVDGFIVVINAVDEDYLRDILESGRPLVLVSTESSVISCPSVQADNAGGIHQAVRHLAEHGHTKIAFAGWLGQVDIKERFEAYKKAITEQGLELDPSLFYDTGDNIESGGEEAAKAMLQAGLPSTAVICGNDYNAVGLTRVLRAAGKELPRDQAVIGFDDTDIAGVLDPPLTSVSQRFDLIGMKAVDLMIKMLNGQKVENTTYRVPTELMVRSSCGCSSRTLSLNNADYYQLISNSDTDPKSYLREKLLDILQINTEDNRYTSLDQILEELTTIANVDDSEVDPKKIGTELSTVLAQLHPDWEAVVPLAESMRQYLAMVAAPHASSSLGHQSEIIAELVISLSYTVMTEMSEIANNLQVTLRNEYFISMDLLRSHEVDPRSLAWLVRTSTGTGLLGLWPEMMPYANSHEVTRGASQRKTRRGEHSRAILELTSSYTASLVSDLQHPKKVAIEEFPPIALIKRARMDQNEITFVLPVRTNTRDFGFLSVVGPVETVTVTGRDVYFQWAALLGVALEHEEMLASLRRQREDLTRLYDREKNLVEEVKASEERYALAARAANDGLWDWDISKATFFYSERWKEMLGYREKEISNTLASWMDLVHEEDIDNLRSKLDLCLVGAASSIECEHRILNAYGQYRWVLCRALAVPGDGRPATRMVGSFTDITLQKELEEKLRHDALYDALTGLPNRTNFLKKLSDAIAESHEVAPLGFAVLFLDLDGFKLVNDSLGHYFGDLLLQEAAKRILSQLRKVDMAARLGGDEFVILLREIATEDEVISFVTRMQEFLARPFELEQRIVSVTATVGIALSVDGYKTADDMLRDADIAMYKAKYQDKGSQATFNSGMREDIMSKLQIDSDLRVALYNNEIISYYQPIVDMRSHELIGLESLARWEHQGKGLELPDMFLPASIDSGFVVNIGTQLRKEAVTSFLAWKLENILPSNIKLSFNIASREFWHQGFLQEMTKLVDEYNCGNCLSIEVTESVFAHNYNTAISILKTLSDLGIEIAIDDFGIGSSSLEMLHKLPVHILKIDRSFIVSLFDKKNTEQLIRAIVALGEEMNWQVIAEGVENILQEEKLLECGCHYGQGFLYSSPLPSREVEGIFMANPVSQLPLFNVN
ncbi:MAG: EAL domain-containing protein [Firmicutes bacterium]|nr:EAL domain-containing protein [Bacillota bacterium]